MKEKTTRQLNRLKDEKSPYLLQHADNPVDWYPWGEDAFEKARQEDKPIFLSIGYSTCHWCHVMADESFEDEEIAKLLNKVFVSIKVDREERPDIDTIYMSICQLLTGSGGWPLTIIMTPDKKPFFAATYIPKENRFGRTGMRELIPQIQKLWITKRDEIVNSANSITSSLTSASKDAPTDTLNESTLKDTYHQLSQRFDTLNGGFGSAPKFPTPHHFSFLLRYWKRSGDDTALHMVEKTLSSMRRGGIYDHVGFGFHRYATDEKWRVPHFEKMLYDQALLAMAYTEAFQATGKKEYGQTAQEIFTYVMRDLTSPEGRFYSAEDADSEGEEGKFYLWSHEEIHSILSQEESELIRKIFNIEKDGNFSEESTRRTIGMNILYLKKSLPEIASDLKLTEQSLQDLLGTARAKLFRARKARIHPHKDDKILTDWNGLMIAAFAKGAQVFNEPLYTETAKNAVTFIFNTMRRADGRLLHRYRDTQAGIPALIDDYAFLVWGLLELYETSFEAPYLRKAGELTQEMIAHFWDEGNGGFYFTPDDGEPLITRPKELYDGALPSGNSVALSNLLRLARSTANTDYQEKAAHLVQLFSPAVKQAPSAYTQLMVGLDFALGPSYEVVIVGTPGAEDTRAMVRALRKEFLPHKVVLFKPSSSDTPEIAHLAPFTKDLSSINNHTTAYICRNYSCTLPTTSIDTALQLLGKHK